MLSRKTDLHRKDLRSLEGHKDIKMPITNMYMVSSKRNIKAAKVLEISSSKYSFRMSIIISYGLPFCNLYCLYVGQIERKHDAFVDLCVLWVPF